MILKNVFKKRSIVILIIMIPIVLVVFPIKFTKKSIDSINAKEFYIVKCVSEGSTDAGCWMCYDQNNMKYSNVQFKGKLPQNIISEDVYNSSKTTFIIYGYIKKINNSYMLYSKGWDFIGCIDRNSNTIRINYKRFITVYDLKWFDFLFSGYNDY